MCESVLFHCRLLNLYCYADGQVCRWYLKRLGIALDDFWERLKSKAPRCLKGAVKLANKPHCCLPPSARDLGFWPVQRRPLKAASIPVVIIKTRIDENCKHWKDLFKSHLEIREGAQPPLANPLQYLRALSKSSTRSARSPRPGIESGASFGSDLTRQVAKAS